MGNIDSIEREIAKVYSYYYYYLHVRIIVTIILNYSKFLHNFKLCLNSFPVLQSKQNI